MTPNAVSATAFLGTELRVSLASNENSEAEDSCVAALTARLVAGEEAAWREFHAAFFDRLLRYLRVVCRGDEHAARESLQTALVKIVRHVRRFDRAEVWWSWLTVIARSCVVDGARRQSRYRALLARYAGFFSALDPSPDELLPDLLDACLDALPATDRALLIAKYHGCQSTAALAADAGCTEKAIESRLARLRQRVKTQLLQRLRDET